MKSKINQMIQFFKTSKREKKAIKGSERNNSKESQQEKHSNEPLAREEIVPKASIMKHLREKSGDTNLEQGMHI